MPVYVDDFYKTPMSKMGRMRMSHLIADTDEELEAFARILGLRREWKHDADHYDISIGTRDKAISYGAQKITYRECAAIIGGRRKAKAAAALAGGSGA